MFFWLIVLIDAFLVVFEINKGVRNTDSIVLLYCFDEELKLESLSDNSAEFKPLLFRTVKGKVSNQGRIIH